MPRQITVTVQSAGDGKTILVHDEDGNELGDVCIDPVPTGFRILAGNPEGENGGMLVVRT